MQETNENNNMFLLNAFVLSKHGKPLWCAWLITEVQLILLIEIFSWRQSFRLLRKPEK